MLVFLKTSSFFAPKMLNFSYVVFKAVWKNGERGSF